jgi:hypothetical protein
MTRRIVLSIIAAVLIVLGGLTAIGGAAVLLLFRSDGRVESGVERISTPTRALVTNTGDVTGVSAAPGWLGRPTVEVTLTDPPGAANTFVGVGPAADVDAYLADVPHDVVTDVEVRPFILQTARQAGTRTPAPPGEQTFWVARGSQNGGTTNLSWQARDGEYRVVIMNTTAGAGVDTNARIGVAIAGMSNVGLLVLIIGLVILALGVVPLVIALATPSRPTAPSGSGSAAPPSTTTSGAPVTGPARDPAQVDQIRH